MFKLVKKIYNLVTSRKVSLAGICLLWIYSGILIFLIPNPSLTFWFTDVIGPPLSLGSAKWFVGSIFISFGLFFLFRIYKSPIKNTVDLYYKCLNCGSTYCKNIENENKTFFNCEKCNMPLEKLDGFFERHPELKENTNKQI